MQIITIYQGASGSGEDLAQMVARQLGYGCIDREVLVEASMQYGIPEAKLTEIIDREPSWWSIFTQRRTPYRMALQASFCELAANQGVVYHGHLGHELVPKFHHVLKVLLTAPMELRIKQVQSRYVKLDDEAARRYIEQADKARSRRLMDMFGTDWRDCSRYDLVVNIGYMNLANAARLIVDTARLPDHRMTEESKRAFENFALGSRVHAHLALDQDLSHGRIAVEANQGAILIDGTIPEWLNEEQLVATVTKVPGVKSVKTDLVKLPSNYGMYD